jgi:hypothetical protein
MIDQHDFVTPVCLEEALGTGEISCFTKFWVTTNALSAFGLGTCRGPSKAHGSCEMELQEAKPKSGISFRRQNRKHCSAFGPDAELCRCHILSMCYRLLVLQTQLSTSHNSPGELKNFCISLNNKHVHSLLLERALLSHSFHMIQTWPFRLAILEEVTTK